MDGLVLNNKGKGIFSRKDWIKESKSLYLSAKVLRKQGKDSRVIIPTLERTDKSVYEHIDLISATDKSSRLLLGYAFELLLKSAVLLMNYGAKKKTIDEKFRQYGHKLDLMVKDLELQLDSRDLELLKYSTDDVVSYARYPVSVYDDENYNTQINSRSINLANNELFEEMVSLYDRLKAMVVKMDNDEQNCAQFSKLTFKDLSLFMRIGGGVKARAIVNYSIDYSHERRTKQHLKLLIEKFPKGYGFMYLAYWDEYEFFEDNGKKLIPLRDF